MLFTVDKTLRRKFLKLYLAQCKMKHQIAFFQWRDMYCSAAKMDQLDEAVTSKIEYIKGCNEKLIKQF